MIGDRFVLVCENDGQWSAVALNYALVGFADSPTDAYTQMCSMVVEHEGPARMLGYRWEARLRLKFARRWLLNVRARRRVLTSLAERSGAEGPSSQPPTAPPPDSESVGDES